MPDWIPQGIFVNLITEFIIVVFGVLVAQRIRRWLDQRNFGGWRAIVHRGPNEVLVRRHVSAAKTKEILEEPAELSVFLKGLVAPYDMLHGDIITLGEPLLKIDHENRCFTVDLRYNPAERKPGVSAPL